MTDEWGVERLDLGAYLARIGHGGEVDPTGATLVALHRAHVGAIPFENLDLVLDRGISVDLDSVQDKLVRRRRGGYCYEHGLLFAAALQRLGYTVDRLLARVGSDEQQPGPRTHMTLHVRAGTEQWLADVGFGAGLLEPLPWQAAGTAHQQGHWTFQLLSRGPGSWQLREGQARGWQTLYSFTDEPQHASDVLMANHFTSTHPASPFVGQLIAMRTDNETRRRLVGRQLTLTRPDGSASAQELTDAAVAAVLRDDFDIPLTTDELDALTATLPPPERSNPGVVGRESDGGIGGS